MGQQFFLGFNEVGELDFISERPIDGQVLYVAPDGFDQIKKNAKLVEIDGIKTVVIIDEAQKELGLIKKSKKEELANKIFEAKKIVIKYGDFELSEQIAVCQEVMVRKFANGDVFDYDIDGSGYSLVGIPREIAHNMQSECERIRTDLRVFEKYYTKKIEDASNMDELNSITFSPINIRGKQFGIDTPFVLEIEQNENISVVSTYGDANA